jgi:hypothetical protein
MHIDAISLSKFLSRYANVFGADLKKVTHEEVSVLFPELERASKRELRTKGEVLAFIKAHKEELLLGKIVLVSAGRYLIPYYTPVLIEDMDLSEEEEMYFEREAVPTRINNKVYDYSTLKEFELRNLLRRKFNSSRNQINARKELESRGFAKTRKYRRCNFKKIDIEED